MATWGLHIRVAENLLNKDHDLDYEKFLVGNIGPDCGEPNEDWSQFNPPKEVSHWIGCGRKKIYPDNFYDAYLSDKVGDKEKRSFYIGYYTHLMVDKEWKKLVDRKKEKDLHYAPLKEDKAFIWTIKKDWYDLDHLYFRENRESLFFKIFPRVETFPDYLHYYPRGAIEKQVKFISDFYLNPPENLDREYIYLTSDEMNDFVDRTVAYTELILEEKGLI